MTAGTTGAGGEAPANTVQVGGWTLSADEMSAIDALNRNKRYNDPAEFCVGMGGPVPIYD